MSLNSLKNKFYLFALVLGGSSVFLFLHFELYLLKFNFYLATSSILLSIYLFVIRWTFVRLLTAVILTLILIINYSEGADIYPILLILLSTQTLLVNKNIKINNLMLFEIINVLIISCTIIGYTLYRITDELSLKIGNANANFVGAISVLLMLHIIITKMYHRNLLLFIVSVLTVLIGLFASSSRGFISLSVFFIFVFIYENKNNKTNAIILISYLLFVSLFILILLQIETIEIQILHIISRFKNDSFLEDKRVAQVLFLYQQIIENPINLIFPLKDQFVSNAIGSGFSDNSLLEISTHTGLFASLLITTILFLRIYKDCHLFYAIFISLAFLMFNIILWLPFIFLFCSFIIILNNYEYRLISNKKLRCLM